MRDHIHTSLYIPVPIGWEAGWASESVLGDVNVVSTANGTPIPWPSSVSQSLYRLRYPSCLWKWVGKGSVRLGIAKALHLLFSNWSCTGPGTKPCDLVNEVLYRGA
jgi:hypothetical protein